MLISNEKYTKIFNVLWKKHKAQKGHYQYISRHGVEVYGLTSMDKGSYIEMYTAWEPGKMFMHITTYNYYTKETTGRNFIAPTCDEE